MRLTVLICRLSVRLLSFTMLTSLHDFIMLFRKKYSMTRVKNFVMSM